MPKPVLALPCGSRSTTSTRFSIAASAVARLIAVVVLPTPPFWLAMARMRPARATLGDVGLSGTADLADAEQGCVRARPAREALDPHVPLRRRCRQFGGGATA